MAKTSASENGTASATTTSKVGIKRFFDFTKEEKIAYSLLIGIILIVVMIRSSFYEISFERDEGTYAYYGKLLLEGKTPYKDFYEQKFPGIFYFYASMVALFGATVKGLHLGFMVLNIATIVILFFASKRLFNPYAASITAITFAIVSLTPNLSGFTVQGEHGVAFFVSLGILAYTYTIQATRIWPYFLLGLAMGAAFMVKTSGVFLGLWAGIAIVSDAVFNGKKFVFGEVLKKALVYTAGVVVVIGFFFALIALKGSFSDMMFWAYEVPKRYVGKIKWEQGKQYLDYTLKAITADYKFFWVHAFLALGVILLKNIPLRLKISGVALLFFSCATIFPGYYFYGHYWIQILPGLAIMAGLTFYGLSSLLTNTFGIKWKNLRLAYVLLFVALTLSHINSRKDYYFNPNYDRILRSVYGNNPFPETRAIANWLNANTKPEDQVVAMGSEPELYFYIGKNCPSRHAYFAALVDSTAEHKQFQKEFIADVENAKPKYFIFYNHQISLFVQRGSDQYIFQWYNKYVTENYNLIGLVDMVDGYAANYVWREQLTNFKPQSQTNIYIYERKS